MTVPDPIKAFERQTWKPVTEEGDDALDASKFAGTPWLEKGESWPLCPHCGNPMQFFLQLNLSHLPAEVGDKFGSGLLQMFYCTNSDPLCEVECEAFFPFAISELIRVIQPGEAADAISVPTFDTPFPAKHIRDWQPEADYPNPEEGEEIGVMLTDDEWEALEEDFPIPGDKLDGWPRWVQGIEYPLCPVCNETMRLVFQLDSNDNLPYLFGDVGCGHITQCETHKEQVAFGWACG